MNEEKIRKMVSDSFFENIMNNLDSSIIFKYIEGLEKENQELNKENDRLAAKLNKNKILQNEFRKWLENEIKRYRKTLSERPTNDLEYNNYKVTDVALEQIKIVLSKYKEIIGGK